MTKRIRIHLLLYSIIFILFQLAGCSFNVTKIISTTLQPEDLYKSFSVMPKDIATRSKCNTPPTVKIVNIENRTEDFEALQGPTVYSINPKELIDSVGQYLKIGFEKSDIKSDDKSSKILQIKMEDLKITAGVWSFGSYFKLNLIIPEKNLSKYYEAEDNAAAGITAAAYAIHSVTRKIIDDEVIQEYILCQ